MPGPRIPSEARKWIREAVEAERYIRSVHFRQRLVERKVTMLDVLHVLRRGPLVEPYPERPCHDGSCWRVVGRDLDTGRRIGVGVETYLGADGKAAVLVTVMEVR